MGGFWEKAYKITNCHQNEAAFEAFTWGLFWSKQSKRTVRQASYKVQIDRLLFRDGSELVATNQLDRSLEAITSWAGRSAALLSNYTLLMQDRSHRCIEGASNT